MATIFNESTAAPQHTGTGITRQRLLTNERMSGTRLLLDRIALAAGAHLEFNLPGKSFAWLQMLDGEATFKANYTDRMTDKHSVLLPPGFPATLTTAKGASLIYAEIPDATQLDAGFLDHPPLFQVMDWTREPVFECEHDARKRISLVDPRIAGSTAIRIDMVIYPSGTKSPKYQHLGAESFVYVVSGRGTASADQLQFAVRQGDVIHFPDSEWHYLSCMGTDDMRFLEFYLPGTFKTGWADPSKSSAWRSTNRDISSHETAHDERDRIVFRKVFGNPWTR